MSSELTGIQKAGKLMGMAQEFARAQDVDSVEVEKFVARVVTELRSKPEPDADVPVSEDSKGVGVCMKCGGRWDLDNHQMFYQGEPACPNGCTYTTDVGDGARITVPYTLNRTDKTEPSGTQAQQTD